MIKRLFGVVVAACAAIALMIGVSSCSDSEVSPETSESGARLAPSVSDYAEQLADKFAGSMDDRQREAVERVVETGEVSQSDYEQALSDYRQCMIDRGYREIIFLDVGGGIREEAAHQAGTDQQERRYAQDSMECGDAHTTVVDELYRMQVGNPELLQDHNEAIADCLRRTGQVESSYDGEQFRREYERYQNGTADSDEWPFSFPEDTSESQMCRVSNGWISVDQTDPVEELW